MKNEFSFAVFRIHFFVWGKLMGTFCLILLAFWIPSYLITKFVVANLDSSRVFRAGLICIFLGIFMPFVTTIFFPTVFDDSEQ